MMSPFSRARTHVGAQRPRTLRTTTRYFVRMVGTGPPQTAQRRCTASADAARHYPVFRAYGRHRPAPDCPASLDADGPAVIKSRGLPSPTLGPPPAG